MGKQKILPMGLISATRRNLIAPAIGTLLLVALTGCAGSQPDRFVGMLQPDSGTCDLPARAVLTINDRYVHFTPHEGVVTLDGTITADGSIHITATLTGLDHRPYPHSVTARVAGRTVTGIYQSPRCRYRFTLSAPPSA
jgi:hypothetical protein